MSNSFLADTSLQELIGSKTIEEVAKNFVSIINPSRAIADVKIDELFGRTGKNRNQLSDKDYEDIQNGTLDVDSLPALQLATEKSYKILCNYINTAQGNRAKAILIKLMSAGDIPETLRMFELHGLKIERDEFVMKLSQYVNSIESKKQVYYKDFFMKVPDAKKIGEDDAWFTTSTDIANILRKYEQAFKNTDNPKTKKDLEVFNYYLIKLRENVRKVVFPDIKDAQEILGMNNSTYKVNIKKAECELRKALAIQ